MATEAKAVKSRESSRSPTPVGSQSRSRRSNSAKKSSESRSKLDVGRLLVSTFALLHERLSQAVSNAFKMHPLEPISSEKIKRSTESSSRLSKEIPRTPRDFDGRAWSNFPRDQSWYCESLRSVIDVVVNSARPDEQSGDPATALLFLRLLLSWLPQRRLGDAALLLDFEDVCELDDSNNLSFTAFAARISSLQLSNQRQLDIVESVVLIVAADILCLALAIPSIVSSDIAKKLVSRLALELIRPSKPRALDGSLWTTIQTVVVNQWSAVLSQLSGTDVVPAVTQLLSSSELSKAPPEHQAAILSSLLLRFNSPYYYSQETEIATLLGAFSTSWFPHTRESALAATSFVVRAACMEILSFWLLTMDVLSLSGPLSEMLKGWFKIVEKYLKSGPEELEESALRLATSILIRSQESFKEQHLEKFLFKTLAKAIIGSKRREVALQCIVLLLWPRTPVIVAPVYFIDASQTETYNSHDVISVRHQRLCPFDPIRPPSEEETTLSHTQAWAQAWNAEMRQSHAAMQHQQKSTPESEAAPISCSSNASDERVSSRLSQLQALLFGAKSSLSRSEQTIEVLSEIVRAMAALNPKYAASTLLPSLLLSTAPPAARTAAIRAMKKMVMTGMYWVRNQLVEAVGAALVSSSLFLQKELKDAPLARIDPPPIPLPSVYPGFQLGAYKSVLASSSSSSSSSSGIRANQPQDAFLGCYERVKRAIESQSLSSRFNQKEMQQVNQLVENRIRWWCGMFGIPYPPQASQSPTFSSASPPQSLSSTSSSSTLFSDEDAISSSSSAFASGWTSASAPPSNAGQGLTSAPATLGRKKKGLQLIADKFGSHDVAREACSALPSILSDVLDRISGATPEWNIAIFFQHFDPELVVCMSHALQRAVVLRNVARAEIVRQLVSAIVCFITTSYPLYSPLTSVEENVTCSLLCHLQLILDLWCLSVAKSLRQDLLRLPPDAVDEAETDFSCVFDEVEALASVCLGDVAPAARATALSILSSVQLLRQCYNVHIQNKGLLWLIQNNNLGIMQRSRHAFLSNLVGGVPGRVDLSGPSFDRILLRVEHCAYSRQELLWSYVLAEVMSTWTDEQLSLGPGSVQVLRIARHILILRVEAWRALSVSEGSSLSPSSAWLAGCTGTPSLRNCTLPLPSALMSSSTAVGAGISFIGAGAIPLSETSSQAGTSLFTCAQNLAGGAEIIQRCMINLPLLHRHVHCMIFSAMACVPSSLGAMDSAPSPETATDTGPKSPASNNVADFESYVLDLSRSEEATLQGYLAAYLPFFFRGLHQSETDRALADSIILSAPCIHWRSFGVLSASLVYKYYFGLSSKPHSRKRQKARPDVANILRRISIRPSFVLALRLNTHAQDRRGSTPILARAFLHFIEEVPSAISSLAKVSTLQISDYLISNAVIVSRLLSAAEELGRTGPSIFCPNSGPLRQFLNPLSNRSVLVTWLSSAYPADASPESTPLAVDWRNVAEAMQSCCGYGKIYASRRSLDESEINKFLGKIKDLSKKKSIQARMDRVLADVSASALAALLALSRCGLLHIGTDLLVQSSDQGAKELRKAATEWGVAADLRPPISREKPDEPLEPSAVSLRWLLAANFPGLLDSFLDKCYTAAPSSNIYIHAFLDQFVESSATSREAKPPTSGIADEYQKFFANVTLLERERIRSERAPLRKEDKEFAKAVVTRGGAILFLSMLCLVNANSNIRARATNCLLRLGPIAVGYSHTVVSMLMQKRYQRLADALSVGSKVLPPTACPSAISLQLVQLVSASCSIYTEEVIQEALNRFPLLNSGQKTWTVEILASWSDHVSLSGPAAQTDVSSDALSSGPGSNRDLNTDSVTKEPTPLRLFQPEQLLEKIFSTVTKELSEQTYMQSSIAQLWVRLAMASDSNMRIVLRFLLSKLQVSSSSSHSARLLAVELFGEQPHQTVRLLVSQLTNLLPTEPQTTSLLSLQQAVASLLADLVLRDVTPFLPHLPQLWTFCLLHLDAQPDRASSLMQALLQRMKTLLLVQDVKNAKPLVKTNGALDTLSQLVRYQQLRVEWVQDRTFQPAPGPISQSPEIASVDIQAWSKSGVPLEPLVQILCQASFLALSCMNMDTMLAPDEIETQQHCQQLGLTFRHAWAQELLRWISVRVSQYPDWIQLSSRATEVLRALIADSSSVKEEVAAPRPLLPEPAVVTNLRSILLNSIYDLHKGFISSSGSDEAIGKSNNLGGQQLQQLMSYRVLSLVDVFVKMAPLLQDESTFLELFWIGVSLLRVCPTPPLASALFERGADLMHKICLLPNALLTKINTSSHMFQRLLRNATDWGYPGLLRLLLRGLWLQPKHNHAIVELLVLLLDIRTENRFASLWELFGLHSESMVTTAMICLIPYLSATFQDESKSTVWTALSAISSRQFARTSLTPWQNLAQNFANMQSFSSNNSAAASSFTATLSSLLFTLLVEQADPSASVAVWSEFQAMLADGPRPWTGLVFDLATHLFSASLSNPAVLSLSLSTPSVSSILAEAIYRCGPDALGFRAKSLLHVATCAMAQAKAEAQPTGTTVPASITRPSATSKSKILAGIIDALHGAISSDIGPLEPVPKHSEKPSKSRREVRKGKSGSKHEKETRDVVKAPKKPAHDRSHSSSAERVFTVMTASSEEPIKPQVPKIAEESSPQDNKSLRPMQRSPSTPSSKPRTRDRRASVSASSPRIKSMHVVEDVVNQRRLSAPEDAFESSDSSPSDTEDLAPLLSDSASSINMLQDLRELLLHDDWYVPSATFSPPNAGESSEEEEEEEEDRDDANLESSDSSDKGPNDALSLPYLPEFDVEGISLAGFESSFREIGDEDVFSAKSIESALQGLSQYSPQAERKQIDSDSEDSTEAVPPAVVSPNANVVTPHPKRPKKSSSPTEGSRSDSPDAKESPRETPREAHSRESRSSRRPKSLDVAKIDKSALSSRAQSPIRRGISTKLRVLGSTDAGSAELGKILSTPALRAKFMNFMLKNNYNTHLLHMLDAIEDFKRELDSAKAAAKAKRIIDRYLPRKSALSPVQLPEQLRSQLLSAYESTGQKNLEPTIFAAAERYLEGQIRDQLPMFINSDFYTL